MTRETDALEADLKALAPEIWPDRPSYMLSIPDSVLLLGTLLRREIHSLSKPPE